MSASKLFDLTGRTAPITGGSRGLGLQIAEVIGDAGARLVISSCKADELENAKAHLEKRGIEMDYIAADNSKDADVLRLADESLAKLGRVDILVNNAGATWSAPAEDYPIEAWDKVMNLNIRSLFILSQHIAKRLMIANKYGRILNLVSIAGLRGSIGVIAYNTSKGAVVNFTRGLAADWGPYGITVNALVSGMFKKLGVAHYAKATLLCRVGGDEDLKGAMLLFVPDAGKRITGQMLAIDGGVSSVGAM